MKNEIVNSNGEKIDYVVEGISNADKTVVFVHGLGVTKDEGNSLYIDLRDALKDDFRVVRFDFSGFGLSNGRDEDTCYNKMVADLRVVLKWVKQEFGGEINIIAHSMGCFVTSLLSPDNINKTFFSGIPNANMEYIIGLMRERIMSKGGKMDENGISIYPRTSGEVQKFGSVFWQGLRSFDPVKVISEFGQKTELVIIHPKQDNIVGNEYIDVYKTISSAKYLEIDGDHSYSKKEDREGVVNEVRSFFVVVGSKK